MSTTPLFADYWTGFIDWWSNVFKSQNAVIITALVVGALAILIITLAGRKGRN